MSFAFMQESENIRLSQRNRPRISWEYGEYPHYDIALMEATKLGFEQNRVQIRRIMNESGIKFLIEPYEESCLCSQVIQYKG
jgi:hypothetical protein